MEHLPELIRQVTDLPTFRELSRQHEREIPSSGREFQEYASEKHRICSAVVTYQDVLDYLLRSDIVTVECVLFSATGHFDRYSSSSLIRIYKYEDEYAMQKIYHTEDTDQEYNEGPETDPALEINFDDVKKMFADSNQFDFAFDAQTLFNIRVDKGCTRSLAVRYTMREIFHTRAKFVSVYSSRTAYGIYLMSSQLLMSQTLYGDNIVTQHHKYETFDEGVEFVDMYTGFNKKRQATELKKVRQLLLQL